MKTNKILAIAFSTILLLGGCTEKVTEREPSPAFEGINEVFFPTTSVSKEFDPADGIVTWKVAISRKDSVGELEVPIVVVENDADIFTVPATFKFADKVKTDTFVIAFPGGEEGITYGLKLTVSDKVINPYAKTISEYNFSFVNLAWTAAPSPAVWVDESWTGAFGMDPQIWYVKYQFVKLSDGSAKYRFLNPYASHPSTFDPSTKTSTPDRYGVYDGFPANYPGDYDDTDKTGLKYAGVVSVTAEGKASWTRFSTGVDWSYGVFLVGNVCVDYTASEDDYPLGTVKDEVITFPENSMYLYIPGYGAYPGGACVINLDSAAYCKEHAVKHIADFEDGFNDQTEMKWNDSIAGTSFFQSEAFSAGWNQVLRKAVDIDSINGEKSEFRNLWSLADLYEEGYCLAFYWDQEKGKITIPSEQPTGKVFAGKEIYAGPSSDDCTIESVTVSGTELTKITFAVALTTEEGGLIGEYEEVLYIGKQINWSIDAFCGNFDYSGTSAFDGTAIEASVAISKVDDATILIDGLHQYSSGIYGTFDAATSTVSIVPQLQDSIGKYDITFFTIDLTDDVSTTAAIILKANMDGSISLSDDTEAMGWVLNSKAAGGLLAAAYDFNLTPAAAPEEEVAPRALAPQTLKAHNGKFVGHKTGKNLSTKGFRIQGQAPRYFLHQSIVPFM